ncbi:amino acid/amide ABC transporter substrate-binding protein, HAAT family [Arboricoccus pini]|uniref:Amino acid/amide ABC transporter substrate-binding protein, HAAT family n=2 Tax=Arboricoccus pini TaxID=1963835 RepID=A0A212Q010_9PROT|nr:amino acid/amide ABC transporter substrate-binding protein, HAAT family [Arboricoccus pini]
MYIKRRSLLAGLGGAALATGSVRLTPALADTEALKIGVINPQIKDCAVVGLPVTRGVQMWAEELNAAGGVNIGGQRVKLDVRGYDNACYTAGEELKAARRAILEDGCKYVLQTYTPACRRAIATLTNEQKVLSIAYGAGYVSKEFPFLMGGVSGSPLANMVIMSHMLAQHPEVKRVAILTNDTSFGKAGKTYMEAGVAPYADRVQIVYNESYNPSASSDMLGLLTPVIAQNPDLIFELGFEGPTKALMVSTATQLGFTGIFGSELWDMPLFIEQGLAAETAGRLYSSPVIDGSEPTISPRVNTFYKNYIERFGIGQWSPWASIAYATAATLEAGWAAAKSADPSIVKDTLYGLETVAHPIFGDSKWSGEEIFGVNHHLLTPMIMYKTDQAGNVVADKTIDTSAWWAMNKDKALPTLKAGGQIFAQN